MKKRLANLLLIIMSMFFSVAASASGNTIIEISKLESMEHVVHKSDIGGKILEINVKNGQFVNKDDVVMRLKNKKIISAYEESKNRYETAKLNYEKIKTFAEDNQMLKLEKAERGVISTEMALQKALNGAKPEELDKLRLSVETAKINYETIKTNYEKNKVLYDKNSIAEQSYLQIKASYESAQNTYESVKKALALAEKGADIEDIKSLESAVKEAKANYALIKKTVDEEIWMYDINLARSAMDTAEAMYDLAKERYEGLEVKSEIAGIVANLNIDEKNKVSDADKLFTILNIDKMLLKVGIEEKYIANIDKKSEIEVYVSAVDQTFKGTIDNINPIADEKTKRFEAEIKIANSNHVLKEGMHGEVTIKL